jgi:ABC-2 type transport system permease protein
MIINAFSKQNRALLMELVRTDFKLRYQGSVLGYTWSLLRPLLLFLIMYVVFVKFLRLGAGIAHYPIYLLLGLVLWQFFSDMTSQGLESVVDRSDLIRKIRIPRWIIVFSASISALINLMFNMVVVLIFMFVNQVDLLITSLWLPFIVIELYALGLGLTLFLSAAHVKYRDIKHIWEVVIQGAFYVTPILYPLSLITNINFQKLLLLNPVAQSIQDARYALVTHDTITIAKVFSDSFARLIPVAICLILLLIGVFYFKKESKDFAENL